MLTHHPAWILTLIQTSPFLIQFPNLITSKPQTNLQTPNPAPAFSRPSINIFQTPFRPIHSQSTNDSPSTISHVSQATPTYSVFTNERSNNDSPEITQLSQELNNLITLHQQIQHPHTLNFHQLSSIITSSNPPTTTPSSDCTPSVAHSSTSTNSSSTTNLSYRTFKRKFPSHPFPSETGTALPHYVNHPYHTNTPDFVQNSLLLFPQYTIKQLRRPHHT